jgi:hypothetical protein
MEVLLVEDEKEVERKAQENLRQFKEWMGKVNKACEQSGITLEQGISFLDSLYKNDHS